MFEDGQDAIVDEVEETAEQTVEVDPVKERRKSLLAGKEELKKKDFGKDTEKWDLYSQQVENARAVFKDEKFIQAQLKTLHGSKSPFSQYVPGKPETVSAPSSKIPELNELNSKAQAAHKKFATLMKEDPAVVELVDYCKTLGINKDSTITVKDKDGKEKSVKVELPFFTPYWNGLNPVRNWIKQNFKEEK